MTYWKRNLAPILMNPSLVPRLHMAEGENELLQVIIRPPHLHHDMHLSPPPYR